MAPMPTNSTMGRVCDGELRSPTRGGSEGPSEGPFSSRVAAALGTAASLRYPKYGMRTAVLNYKPPTTGANNNVNALRQTMIAALGDVDPADNKVHVRFAVAPVLQNPSHGYTDQPYYFVRLQN